MKKLLLALALLLFSSPAFAQCNGVFPNNTACGNISGGNNTPRAIPLTSFPANVPGGTTGQIQYNAGGNTFAGVGPITCPTGQALNIIGLNGTPTCSVIGIGSASTVTGTNTTYTSAQGGTIVKRLNFGVPMSDLLPGTSPGALPANTVLTIQNADTVAILSIKSGAGATINSGVAGTGFVYLCPGQLITFYSDGTNYQSTTAPPPCVFTANTTIFIATTGSNTNDGLTASTPLADIQAAWNLAQRNFNISGFSLTLKLAAGTYAKTLYLGGLIPGQGFGDATQSQPSSDTTVFIIGDTTTPANVIIGGSSGGSSQATYGVFNIFNGARIGVLGVKLASTFNQYGFYVAQAWLSFKQIDFGSLTGTGSKIHISLNAGANVVAYTPYTISAGSGCHIIAASGGFFQYLGGVDLVAGTITLTGTPAFSSGFACIQQSGGIAVSVANTFSGSATGPRYNGSFNGTIDTGGQGVNYFPGSSAGALSTGAQYN